MPSGFMQRFKGRIQAAQLWVGPGASLFDSVSGLAAFNDFLTKTSLPVTAVANTDFSLSLPPGKSLLSATVYTSVAYTGTTVTIQAGSTLGGVDYIAATTIKALGVFPLSLVAAGLVSLLAMPNASPNFFVRVVQTGPTAVGSGTLLLNFA